MRLLLERDSKEPEKVNVTVSKDPRNHPKELDVPVHSHSFNIKDIQDDREIAVLEIFDNKPPNSEFVLYCQRLFNALFEKDSKAWKYLKDGPKCPIILDLKEDLTLDLIPWEYALSDEKYLVQEHIFTRQVSPTIEVKKDLVTTGPLRIVIAAPDPLPSEEFDPADLKLGDQLRTFINNYQGNSRKVTLECVRPATINKTNSVLTDNVKEPANVFHFMGHCARGERGRALLFEDEITFQSDLADPERLILTPEYLRLAVLSACDTREIARSVAKRGVQYAIGSYCHMPDDIARIFEKQFYSCLTRGHSIDEAMLGIRKEIIEAANSFDRRQKDYFAGSMILYSSTPLVAEGMFKLKAGVLKVNYNRYPNNLDDFYTKLPVCGRKRELRDLNYTLSRMATRASETARVYTITGMGGQGKSMLAKSAALRIGHVFPGGVFFHGFKDSEKISFRNYLVKLQQVLFSKDISSADQATTDIEKLKEDIFRQFKASCLFILDHADTLKSAEARGEEDAVNLVNWLKEVTSRQNISVKILATSQETLRWPDENTINLKGFTALDEVPAVVTLKNSDVKVTKVDEALSDGVQLFVESLDYKTKKVINKDENKALLNRLVKFMDGHPLSLVLLGRATVNKYKQLQETVIEVLGETDKQKKESQLTKILGICYTEEKETEDKRLAKVIEHYAMIRTDTKQKDIKERFRINYIQHQHRLMEFVEEHYADELRKEGMAWEDIIKHFIVDQNERLTEFVEKDYTVKFEKEWKDIIEHFESEGQHMRLIEFVEERYTAEESMEWKSIIEQFRIEDSRNRWLIEFVEKHYAAKLGENGVTWKAIMEHFRIAEGQNMRLIEFIEENYTAEIKKGMENDIIEHFRIEESQNKRLIELVEEHYATMIGEEDMENKELKKHFGQMLNTLPAPQRLLLYMCTLFIGPITKEVLAFVSEFIDYASAEKIESSPEAIVKNLKDKCFQDLISDEDGEYRIHVALKECARQSNSELKLSLRLTSDKINDGQYIIGIINASKQDKGRCILLKRLLKNLRSKADSAAKYRNRTIQYYRIDETGTHSTNEHQPLLARLAVFKCKVPICDVKQVSLPENTLAFILHFDYNTDEDLWYDDVWYDNLRESLNGKFSIIRPRSPYQSTDKKKPVKIDKQETKIASKKYISNVRLSHKGFFGREAELNELIKLLNDNNRYITVRGFAGVGKTALALQAVEKYNAGKVLALSLAKPVKPNSVIRDIAQFLQIDTEMFSDFEAQQKEIMRKLELEDNDETFLLYLDGMDDVRLAQDDDRDQNAQLMIFLATLPRNVKILSTSRTMLYWPNEKLMELDGLEPSEGAKVFREWLSNRSGDVDEESTVSLSKLVNGHPLVLSLLGSMFNRCQEQINDFIKNINNRISNANDPIENEMLEKSINRSFQYLDRDLQSFLGQLTFFETPFTMALVTKAFGDTSADKVHKLWQLGWLERREYKDDPVIGKFDDWCPETFKNDKFYNLHPLMRHFLGPQNPEVRLDDAEFQFYTALCYGAGFDVKVDIDKQIEWCLKAAKNQHLEAQLTIAECYEQRVQSYEQPGKRAENALIWWKKVAEAGVQEQIASWRGRGFGVDPENAELTQPQSIKFDLSLPFLHRAAQHGAASILGSMLRKPGSSVSSRDRHDRTPLHWAAMHGHLEVVDLLVVEFGENPNVVDSEGRRPVHFAAEGNSDNHLEMVKYLIELGADKEAESNDGRTLLHFAAEGRNIDIVTFLIGCGAKIEAKSKDNWTILHSAAKGGNLRIVELLIEKQADLAAAKDNDNWTPLLVAARYGHIRVLKYLVKELEVDTSDKLKDNQTPLHLAAYYGFIEVVNYLVTELKVAVNTKDINGRTPLHMAVVSKHLNVVKFFTQLSSEVVNISEMVNTKDNNNQTPLHLAVMVAEIDLVKSLVTVPNAEVNAKDKDGQTPLHLAVKNKNVSVDLIEVFVTGFKVEVNEKDNKDQTPLHLAVINENADLVEKLAKLSEVNVNAENKDGQTPLHLAVRNENVDLVEKLAKLYPKLNVNAKDKDGQTPLHLAVKINNVDLLEKLAKLSEVDVNVEDKDGQTPLHLAVKDENVYLVEKLAKINAKDKDGQTPLHLAVKNNNVDLLEKIAKLSEVDVNAEDNDGQTPLHLAVKNENTDLVEKLANINAKDKDGQTPLHLAVKNKSVDLVKFLLMTLPKEAVNTKDNNGQTPLHLAMVNGNIGRNETLPKVDVNAKDNNGQTPLHLAVKNEDIENETLPKVDVNTKDDNGQTPLHQAVKNESINLVKFFVELKTEIITTMKIRNIMLSDQTPLEKERIEIIRLLIEHEADRTVKDEKGRTPFDLALEKKEYIKIVENLSITQHSLLIVLLLITILLYPINKSMTTFDKLVGKSSK